MLSSVLATTSPLEVYTSTTAEENFTGTQQGEEEPWGFN